MALKMVTKFTCDRCGKEEEVEAEQSPNADGWVPGHVPAGWGYEANYLLCPDCRKRWDSFWDSFLKEFFLPHRPPGEG